jgi:hypothetical protein
MPTASWLKGLQAYRCALKKTNAAWFRAYTEV